MSNSTPLQQRKDELKAFIQARNKATMSLAFYDVHADWVREIDFLPHGKLGKIICDLKDSTGVNRDLESESTCANGDFIALAFNQAAQIAEDLIIAIEALEKISNNFCACSIDDEIIPQVEAREALEKLTKAE